MIVNFEFFDEEPIENVITCLHHKIDKVIFFGERKILEGRRKYTEDFLRSHCNVTDVDFIEISASKPNKIIDTMKRAIEWERKQNNDCYFDITGGEGLSLFAFGAVSKDLDVPVHMYDIEKDELCEFKNATGQCISNDVPAQNIHLNLEKYIEMHGGKINPYLNKNYKHQHTEADLQHIQTLWDLSHQFSREWNQLANFLSQYAQEPHVSLDFATVRAGIETRRALSINKIIRILDACSDAGILYNVTHANGTFTFSYVSDLVMRCMCVSGDVLEQYTFLQEYRAEGVIDCQIGVHIDWDGVLHYQKGQDVINEIDVLALYGNVPVFISCKNGAVDKTAMYELQTVTERFGGKYARKVLAVTKPIAHVYELRAQEMGIEIRVL